MMDIRNYTNKVQAKVPVPITLGGIKEIVEKIDGELIVLENDEDLHNLLCYAKYYQYYNSEENPFKDGRIMGGLFLDNRLLPVVMINGVSEPWETYLKRTQNAISSFFEEGK